MARQLNLKGRQKNLKAVAAVAGGVLVIGVGGYLALYSPQKSKASTLNTEIATAQQQLATAQATANVPPPKDPRVDDLFRLTKAMPATPDMPGILLELSRVAKDTGISFDSIAPGVAAPGSGFQTLPIQLSFQGNYYELSDFLFRLNNLVVERDGKLDVGGRLYSVDGVDFSPVGTSGRLLKASVTAKAFIYGTNPTADGGVAAGGSVTPAAPATPATPAPAAPAPATPPASAAAAPAAGGSS
jgi:Tfp pilus assembly protein PilO